METEIIEILKCNDIDNLDLDSMFKVGRYYEKQKDYDNMMKYYLMANEKGNLYVSSFISAYYEKQKDYNNMIKYYLINIQKNIYCTKADDMEYYDSKVLIYIYSKYKKEILNNIINSSKNYIKKDDNLCECSKETNIILYCGHSICQECLEKNIDIKIISCNQCLGIIC